MHSKVQIKLCSFNETWEKLGNDDIYICNLAFIITVSLNLFKFRSNLKALYIKT